MQYIAHRRFKQQALCGPVNIKAGTSLQLDGVNLLWGDRPICVVTSENAHLFFARDDDGMGMERGRLTSGIVKQLAKRDRQHQARWDKIWEDTICQKYKRTDFDDYWMWNHDFFNADIADLRHIAELTGVKTNV